MDLMKSGLIQHLPKERIMGRVKAVTAGLQCLALLGIALFAMCIAEAQEAKQVFPTLVPPPLKELPAFTAVQTPDIQGSITGSQRLNIVIDPKTPLADLLPSAPKNPSKPANPFLTDLKMVPEVSFQETLSSKLTSEKATFEIAHQLTKIRHANQKKSDAFVEALIDHRADLHGMPFAMGDACRTLGTRAKYLAIFSAGVRSIVSESTEVTEAMPTPRINAGKFWGKMAQMQAEVDLQTRTLCDQDRDDLEAARVGVVMQILGPESSAVRTGLVKFLSKTPHVDATRALARLVLFSAEDEVRLAAIQALKLRREKDYSFTLVQGFRYPLPEVARRAADALIRLECNDAVPQLIDMLDESDPRLPVTKEVEGKKVAVVQEMVRVNHHRNCMLCHAPSDTEVSNAAAVVRPKTFSQTTITEIVPVTEEITVKAPDGGKDSVKTVTKLAPVTKTIATEVELNPSLSAQVPLPNEQLPSLSEGGYGRGGSSPDIMVRIDVTYLRQDFSLMMPVHEAAPWPDMQRFDFLVRSRVLSAKEAEEFRQQAPKAVAGSTTPYQRAILFALRELTQRDTAPTPQAWRELLALPAKTGE
jgi:hypothetical protein